MVSTIQPQTDSYQTVTVFGISHCDSRILIVYKNEYEFTE